MNGYNSSFSIESIAISDNLHRWLVPLQELLFISGTKALKFISLLSKASQVLSQIGSIPGWFSKIIETLYLALKAR